MVGPSNTLRSPRPPFETHPGSLTYTFQILESAEVSDNAVFACKVHLGMKWGKEIEREWGNGKRVQE
jgi:hypothetical protein